jgi:hypothetical protein
LSAATWLVTAAGVALCQVQPDPQDYSISTPRPINPAASTTNPSALATQGQNPYLGSTPAGKATDEVISLSLQAVERGLRYNLGLIESSQGTAEVRAQRLRALSASCAAAARADSSQSRSGSAASAAARYVG